jgi:hypothetical protein
VPLRTAKLGSLAPGVNNRLEPTELATLLPDQSRGTYLYGADNVDITQKGYLKRRRGTTKTISGPAHSLWSDPPYSEAYAVSNGNLQRLTNAGVGLSAATVLANMPTTPISYSRGADGDVYWSNGQTIRRISAGVDRPIVTGTPNPVPTLAVGSGALAAGRYLVAFTASGPDGESPSTPVVEVDLLANSSLAYAAASAVNVFMSAPNGDILTLQTSGAHGTIAVYNGAGRRSDTTNMAAMPAGTIVRHYNGRMLVANGPTLYISEPYNYGVYNPSLGYVTFDAAITALEPTGDVLYICTDNTYFIKDLFSDTLNQVLPYGAIPGTSGQSPDSTSFYWQSPRGLVIADQTGGVKNVQESVIGFAPAVSGASLFRHHDGAVHIVTSRQGVQTNVADATSFMEAEVLRQGTVI